LRKPSLFQLFKDVSFWNKIDHLKQFFFKNRHKKMFKKLFVIILFTSFHLTLSQDEAATTAVEPTTIQSTTIKPQSDQQTQSSQSVSTTETTRKPFRLLRLVGDGMVGVLEAKIDFLQRQSDRIKKLFSIR